MNNEEYVEREESLKSRFENAGTCQVETKKKYYFSDTIETH